MRWALVTRPHPGPASQAASLAAALASRGLDVRGFVQQPGEDGAQELVRLGADERVSLALRGAKERPGLEPFCGFSFATAAFERARAWVASDVGRCDVLVLDEVSKLEVAGRGHHDALRLALEAASPEGALVVACVRADQLGAMLERFSPGEPLLALEAPLSAEGIDAFADAVHRRCGAGRKRA